MVSTSNTSASNVYSIMSSPSAAMSNTDPNKALTQGSDIQQNVKEVMATAEKGSTDKYIQSLHKLDVRV